MLPGSSLRVPGSPFCRAWTSMTDQDPEVSVGAFPNRGLVLVGTSLVLVLHREGRTQEPRENDHPIRTTPPWLLLLKERGASEPKGVGGGTCAPPTSCCVLSEQESDMAAFEFIFVCNCGIAGSLMDIPRWAWYCPPPIVEGDSAWPLAFKQYRF